MSKYDHYREVHQCRDNRGDLVFSVMGEPCPRVFPHAVSGNCNKCAEEDWEYKIKACRIWQVAQNHYEPIPLKRRIAMACTTFINWIGSWSKN